MARIRSFPPIEHVLRSCERRGSLDSDIERGSVIANDFKRFFARHPGVDRVFFNGAHAETLFRRHVSGTIAHAASYARLPSTSPANASIARSAKVDAWRVVAL